MLIAKIKCRCGRWIRLRANNSNDEMHKTCWVCKPYSTTLKIERIGGYPVGYRNGVRVPNSDLDVELNERN
jgi:hypothetical protein